MRSIASAGLLVLEHDLGNHALIVAVVGSIHDINRFFTLRPSDAAGPAPWTERTFDASALPSGTYIVRARVDRAESPTSYAEGPGAPRPPLTVTLP